MSKSEKGILRIDGDGIPAYTLPYILNVFKEHAEVFSIEVYCKAGTPNYRAWHDSSKLNGAKLMSLDSHSGRNATDIWIAIQTTLDLLLKQRIGVYGIATSDYDFHPAAKVVRSFGCKMLGFGYSQTPLMFQTSCSRFTLLTPRSKAAAARAEMQYKRRKAIATSQDLTGFLKASFANAAGELDQISHARFVQEIKRQKQAVVVESDIPINWKKVLESMSSFELLDEDDVLMVQLSDDSQAA